MIQSPYQHYGRKKPCQIDSDHRKWYSTSPTEKCKLYDLVLGLHSCIQGLNHCKSLGVSSTENLTHDCLKSQSKVWNETCICLKMSVLAALAGHYHKLLTFKFIPTT